MDFLYRMCWNGLMNVVITAIAVFLVRSFFVLFKRRVVPYIWGLVFLSAILPVGAADVLRNGYVLEAFFSSSFRFWFFLLWEGVASVLLLLNFLKCRRRKWKALECKKVDEDVFVMEGLKRTVVCGFFHPVIYVPCGLDEKTQAAVLERKRRLIASGGQKLTVIADIITYLNWFNPVLWFSRYYMREDMKRL